MVHEIAVAGRGTLHVCDICGETAWAALAMCASTPAVETDDSLPSMIVEMTHGEYNQSGTRRRLVRQKHQVIQVYYAAPSVVRSGWHLRDIYRQSLAPALHEPMVKLNCHGLIQDMTVTEMRIRERGIEQELDEHGLILPGKSPVLAKPISLWRRLFDKRTPANT